MTRQPLDEILRAYDANAPLEWASTVPASWYVDERVLARERQTVFARAWQVAGRVAQVREPGRFLTTELAGGEPIVVVRGRDGLLRAFFNVCRHHAAAVVTEPEGSARVLRCPYHGWTYGLDGALKGTPDFAGVCGFDPAAHGLVPVSVGVWGPWVFVRVAREGPALEDWLDEDLQRQAAALDLDSLHWVERRRYVVECNWKVFIDNYLDGGYHVPYVHRRLDTVLDYAEYAIENGRRYCLQSSPMVAAGADPATRAVRTGDRARYYWLYPNFMINCYEGVMDTNLVTPRGVDRTEVVFDFYFADDTEQARAEHEASIAVSHAIQEEDAAICAAVQRGLRSGAYDTGRLSVRREGGEHLFHRLLHADLAGHAP